jgi:hypothetical protein
MKHFTCDLCGKHIAHERYVARVQIAAAFDPEKVEPLDIDGDHLEQIAGEIAELEDTGQFTLPDNGAKTFEFDLCTGCQRRFVRDPLSRMSRQTLKYSPN